MRAEDMGRKLVLQRHFEEERGREGGRERERERGRNKPARAAAPERRQEAVIRSQWRTQWQAEPARPAKIAPAFAPIPTYDEQIGREYRNQTPPEFPLTLPFIVHHLSGLKSKYLSKHLPKD